jgi:hypothetical protein
MRPADAASKLLEDAIVAAANSSSSSARRSAQPGVDQAAAVVALFDLSCLKYRDVDDLVEVMGSYRTKVGRVGPTTSKKVWCVHVWPEVNGNTSWCKHTSQPEILQSPARNPQGWLHVWQPQMVV